MSWGPLSINTPSRTLGMFQVRVGDSASNIATVTPVLTPANSLGAMASTKYAGVAEFYRLESGYPRRLDGQIPLSVKADITCAYKEQTPYNWALAHGLNPNASISATATQQKIKSTAGTTAWISTPITVTDDDGPVSDTWIVAFVGATAGIITGVDTGYVYDFTTTGSPMAPVNPLSTGGTIPYFTIPADFFSTWAADDTYIFRTSMYVEGTSLYSSQFSGALGLGSISAPAYMRVEAVLTYPDEEHHMYIILPRAQAAAAVEFDAGDDEVNVPIMFSGTTADSSTAGGNAVWNFNKTTGVGPLGRVYWA